jgi:hypothetical protein
VYFHVNVMQVFVCFKVIFAVLWEYVVSVENCKILHAKYGFVDMSVFIR